MNIIEPMTPGDRIECEWKDNVVVSRRIVRKNGEIDKLPALLSKDDLRFSDDVNHSVVKD